MKIKIILIIIGLVFISSCSERTKTEKGIEKTQQNKINTPVGIESRVSQIISNQPISLKRINAAKTEYCGMELEIYGYLELSDYYNWGYEDSENSHYSFKLRDNKGERVVVYFKKSISKDLFNKLVDVDELPVKLKVIAYQSKQGIAGDLLLEGLSYEIIE